MIAISENLQGDCGCWRTAIQERLDNRSDRAKRIEIEGHLGWCSDCRDYEESLLLIRGAIATLPEIPFPDTELGSVWAGKRRGTTLLRRAPAWRGLAAAAVLALAMLASWNASSPSEASPERELARIASDARPALRILGRAFERIEEATVNEVLIGPLSRAVRYIPIKWTGSSSH